MATLRAFQSEIENIQTKSVEQQRIAIATSAALADKKLKPKETVDQTAKDTPMSPVADNEDEEDLCEIQVGRLAVVPPCTDVARAGLGLRGRGIPQTSQRSHRLSCDS